MARWMGPTLHGKRLAIAGHPDAYDIEVSHTNEFGAVLQFKTREYRHEQLRDDLGGLGRWEWVSYVTQHTWQGLRCVAGTDQYTIHSDHPR